MNLARTLNGAALATAAAAVFLTAPIASAGNSHTKLVACQGVNACKGHSSCKSASNACKGQNSCKGQGFVDLTKEQCDQVGGTVQSGTQ